MNATAPASDRQTAFPGRTISVALSARQATERPNLYPPNRVLPARRSRRTSDPCRQDSRRKPLSPEWNRPRTISAHRTALPCGHREARSKSEGLPGSAAQDRDGRIQVGAAGLARQPGEKALADYKMHIGARRFILKRTSAMGSTLFDPESIGRFTNRRKCPGTSNEATVRLPVPTRLHSRRFAAPQNAAAACRSLDRRSLDLPTDSDELKPAHRWQESVNSVSS